MKSSAFEYLRSHSVLDAMSAYAEADGDAIYLSGGQSVVPSLNLRLQAPALVIDLSGVAKLSGISLQDGWLRIGAMTRHAQVITDPLIAAYAPLFAAAAPFIAHPAIRNRGTLGGSLAHADPASEFPAAAVAMRVELEIASPEGTRRVPADDFFLDIYETALEPGEILLAIHVPSTVSGQMIGFDEITRRRGDYAMVGVAVQAVSNNCVLDDISIAFFSVGSRPTRAVAAQSAVIGRAIDGPSIADAQAALADDLDPSDEADFPASMRMHLARVLLGRVLSNLEAVV